MPRCRMARPCKARSRKVGSPRCLPLPRSFSAGASTPAPRPPAQVYRAARRNGLRDRCSVGLSATSAYNLRRRPDAHAFRHTWDAATDCGMRRLVDAALARAVHSVPVRIFYKGEQVGARREYLERVAMFLMRTRAPIALAPQGQATQAAAPRLPMVTLPKPGWPRRSRGSACPPTRRPPTRCACPARPPTTAMARNQVTDFKGPEVTSLTS